ncbi:hypothetical protein OEIGOIKO_05822 [Streptomyces chrestomyceticus JCM 4735]|uniref:DNA polymerase III beta sliding clamp central domain-containing protein n=1 Tax=Streptomyces chrestomyceticus JCM 4735 TaxID=1306181 RepID=A0A7U9L065_9ACTN|nr:hypothetical protein [Streptomyces chrestomyceticus]GCD38012.1 hypothetical protein OEIGOIKO_05822 [Streptomyces chrestomyceticus JCM 4735]
MTSLNAHRLLRLIEVTTPHVGSEYHSIIHGIRLDWDGTMLHAVATDRFTLAVARTRLDAAAAPWALTIPQPDIEWLTSWLQSLPGDRAVTLTPTADTLTLTTDTAKVTTARSDEFIAWRDIVRTALANPLTEAARTSLSPRLLTRWELLGYGARFWQPAAEQPVVIVAEDVLGLQMPMRFTGEPTREDDIAAWAASLGDGPHAELTSPQPAPGAVAEFQTTALRATLRATSDIYSAPHTSPLFSASVTAGCYAWAAHRFLVSLRTADPGLAERITREVNAEMESGEIGEFAYDAAQDAGHDPEQWRAEFEQHKAKQAAKQPTSA